MAKKQYQKSMEGGSREAFLRRAIAEKGLTIKDFAICKARSRDERLVTLRDFYQFHAKDSLT